jgi:hypothetical protein
MEASRGLLASYLSLLPHFEYEYSLLATKSNAFACVGTKSQISSPTEFITTITVDI